MKRHEKIDASSDLLSAPVKKQSITLVNTLPGVVITLTCLTLRLSANTASFFLNFEIMSSEFFNKAEYASLVIPSLHVKNYINSLMQTTSVSTYLYDKQKRTANAVPVLQYGGESGI